MIREGDTGRVLGMGAVVRDISDLRRSQGRLRESQEELRLSQAKLAGIVSASPDAIISIDRHQRITLFNEAAEEIFGHSRAEAIGAAFDLLIPTAPAGRLPRAGRQVRVGSRVGARDG